MTETWAVVPSDGRDYLTACLASLRAQVDGIVVVANGALRGGMVTGAYVVDDTGTDRNISRWWNIGIDTVARSMPAQGVEEWNVLVVNDDVVAPAGLVARLGEALRSGPAVLAYPNQHDKTAALHVRAEPVSLFHRITGYTFMLRGESGLRADEDLVWWYGDDDLDWRARQAGGAVLVPGCPVLHLAPNGYTAAHPDLQEQAGRDRAVFAAKWGATPW